MLAASQRIASWQHGEASFREHAAAAAACLMHDSCTSPNFDSSAAHETTAAPPCCAQVSGGQSQHEAELQRQSEGALPAGKPGEVDE